MNALPHFYPTLLALRIGGSPESLTMNYGLAGRKISMGDPDKGYWQYFYKALGEMTQQIDAKGQIVEFDYDPLGRVEERREIDALGVLLNREISTYNDTTSGPAGKGQLISVSYTDTVLGDALQTKTFFYDSLGRVEKVLTTISGENNEEPYEERTTYDEYGRVFQQFDVTGDGRGIHNLYNDWGYLESIREAREGAGGQVYQTILNRDAHGNVTSMTLGNGVSATATYDPRNGRLENLSAYKNNSELQNVDYIFDILGNLKQRHDMSVNTDFKEIFGYDNLNRLKQVDLTSYGVSNTTLWLDYDETGNITRKSDVGDYLYGQSNAGPHAVTTAGGVSYSYDANGNQIAGDGRSIVYTVFDKASRIIRDQSKVEFSYGIGNSRYQRKDYESLVWQKTTTYLGSVERIENLGENPYFKRYLGGVAIANYYPTSGVQRVEYLLKDHIGSIHTVLDNKGRILETMHFSAFGQRQDVANWIDTNTSFIFAPVLNEITTRGFTGHEMVDTVGIIHMNGRVYDPKLGRFLQADPHVQAPKNSQSLNRYSYVFNNPLSYTDPSGYFSIGKFFKKYWRVVAAVAISVVTVGALAGAAWAGALGTFASGLQGFSAYAFAAAGGALAGGISTGTLRGAIIGGLTAVASMGIANHLSGGKALFANAGAGGINSELSGGKFGHGFFAAGFTASMNGTITRIGGRFAEIKRTVTAALIGGTASRISGGKFANGATTAALSYAIAAGAQAGSDSLYSDGEEIAPDITDIVDKQFHGKFVTSQEDGVNVLTISISVGKSPLVSDSHFSNILDGFNGWNGTSAVYDGVTYTVRLNITKVGGFFEWESADLRVRPWRNRPTGCGKAGCYSNTSTWIRRSGPGFTMKSITAAHELGHFFGLGHQGPGSGDIMSYDRSRGFGSGTSMRRLYETYNN